MFEYNQAVRALTKDEQEFIEQVVYMVRNRTDEFTVYIDTSDPRCLPLIITMIKVVKERCRGITGCVITSEKIVFGRNRP